MEINESLENLGMGLIEIKIYLYLLKEGPRSRQNVSDDNHIVRQTIYEVMNKMLSKGYITYSMTEKRKLFSAIPPEILLDRLREKEEQFKQVIPLLQKFHKEDFSDMFVESFMGVKGFKSLLSLTLRSKTELLWLASEEINKSIFEDYYHENYVLKRVEAKISLRLLTYSTNRKIWHSDKQSLREVRLLKFIEPIKSASFVVFEDKVILFSFNKDNLFGILIKNNIIKEMFRSIFLDYWRRSRVV